jgi:hypothetical protein
MTSEVSLSFGASEVLFFNDILPQIIQIPCYDSAVSWNLLMCTHIAGDM